MSHGGQNIIILNRSGQRRYHCEGTFEQSPGGGEGERHVDI